MRGTLGKMPGVTDVMIRQPIRDFTVTYDPAMTDVDAILDALRAAGEPASRK